MTESKLSMSFTINGIFKVLFLISIFLLNNPAFIIAQTAEKKQEEYDNKREKQLQDLKKAEKEALKKHYKMQSPEVRKRMRQSKRQSKRNNPRTHKWYHKIWYGTFHKKVYWD